MAIYEMAKVNGVFVPVNDMEQERVKRFKDGLIIPVEIKLGRNPEFHGKVFAFFNFCFEYWQNDNDVQEEKAQSDQFRKDMTVLAGFYDVVTNIKGEKRKVAKSLAFAAMDQDEFEMVYKSLINVALKYIFKDIDEVTENRLLSFF